MDKNAQRTHNKQKNIQNIKLTRRLNSISSLIFIQICIIIRSLIISIINKRTQ